MRAQPEFLENENLIQAYYINFPQGSKERENPKLLWPKIEALIHQNSIFELIWTDQDRKIVSASGDQTGVVFDIAC